MAEKKEHLVDTPAYQRYPCIDLYRDKALFTRAYHHFLDRIYQRIHDEIYKDNLLVMLFNHGYTEINIEDLVKDKKKFAHDIVTFLKKICHGNVFKVIGVDYTKYKNRDHDLLLALFKTTMHFNNCGTFDSSDEIKIYHKITDVWEQVFKQTAAFYNYNIYHKILAIIRDELKASIDIVLEDIAQYYFCDQPYYKDLKSIKAYCRTSILFSNMDDIKRYNEHSNTDAALMDLYNKYIENKIVDSTNFKFKNNCSDFCIQNINILDLIMDIYLYDCKMLSTVLSNLLSNGIKSTSLYTCTMDQYIYIVYFMMYTIAIDFGKDNPQILYFIDRDGASNCYIDNKNYTINYYMLLREIYAFFMDISSNLNLALISYKEVSDVDNNINLRINDICNERDEDSIICKDNYSDILERMFFKWHYNHNILYAIMHFVFNYNFRDSYRLIKSIRIRNTSVSISKQYPDIRLMLDKNKSYYTSLLMYIPKKDASDSEIRKIVNLPCINSDDSILTPLRMILPFDVYNDINGIECPYVYVVIKVEIPWYVMLSDDPKKCVAICNLDAISIVDKEIKEEASHPDMIDSNTILSKCREILTSGGNMTVLTNNVCQYCHKKYSIIKEQLLSLDYDYHRIIEDGNNPSKEIYFNGSFENFITENMYYYELYDKLKDFKYLVLGRHEKHE